MKQTLLQYHQEERSAVSRCWLSSRPHALQHVHSVSLKLSNKQIGDTHASEPIVSRSERSHRACRALGSLDTRAPFSIQPRFHVPLSLIINIYRPHSQAKRGRATWCARGRGLGLERVSIRNPQGNGSLPSLPGSPDSRSVWESQRRY